jgi:hypothetical protein
MAQGDGATAYVTIFNGDDRAVSEPPFAAIEEGFEAFSAVGALDG